MDWPHLFRKKSRHVVASTQRMNVFAQLVAINDGRHDGEFVMRLRRTGRPEMELGEIPIQDFPRVRALMDDMERCVAAYLSPR
jgi:hypothetical protein